MPQFYTLLLLFVFSTVTAQAAEESLDLETENKAPVHQSVSTAAQKFSIMGRVDLTVDRNSHEQTAGTDARHKTEVKNNHGLLLFLKIKASPKVSFMGEFVDKSFYAVDFEATNYATFSFGKILVPFGDNRYFHHYYGGRQGDGGTGIMLPNIWAETGANIKWHFSDIELDTYWVNSIRAEDINSDPNFRGEGSDYRQAVGTRVKFSPLQKLSVLASGYRGEYWPGRPIFLGGLDLYTDYGFIDWLSKIRLSMGIAQAWIEGSPTGENYIKSGDYIQLSTNIISSMDWRLRYGTYEHDDRVETQDDSQTLALGVSVPVDVLRLLIEHQLVYEEVNEIDNDLTRLMLSLDF